MEYGISGRSNVIPAPITGIGFATSHTMENAIASTLRAIDSLRVFLAHDVIQTGIVIREHLLKVFEREFLHRAFGLFAGLCGHRVSPNNYMLSHVLLVVKGYLPNNDYECAIVDGKLVIDFLKSHLTES